MPRRTDHARVSFRIAPFLALSIALIGAGRGLAQDDAPRKPAGVALTPVFDLAFVPNDAPVVLAFRPAALLQMPDLKGLYNELTADEHIKRVVDVAEPETVEQVTFVLLSRDIPLGGDPGEALARAGAVVVKTNKAREWKALAAAGGLPLVKATHAGKDYYKASGDAGPGFGFFQPDEKTLVIAAETNLHKMMDRGEKSDAPKPARWREALVGASGTPIAVAAVDFAWVHNLVGPQIKAEPQAALALSVIGPIWDKTDDLVLAVSASEADGITLTADHLCADEEGATRVMDTVRAFLTLGRNVAPEGLRLLREQAKGDPVAADVASVAEQALKSATADRNGTRVRLKISARADIAKYVREAVKR